MTTLMNTLATLTDDELIAAYAAAQEAVENAADYRDRVAFLLTERLNKRGATALPHPDFEVRLETPVSYDPGIIATLGEHMPPEEFHKGYTPEHLEPVPAKADGRVIRGWIKYGGDVAETIQRAVIPGKPKLRVTPRKGGR